MSEMNSPQAFKEEGNLAFKSEDFDTALKCYNKAIDLTKDCTLEKAVYYKNRAAVYLKKHQYKNVIDDCANALEISPNDPKALYRRCQALEALERYEEAYRDARQVLISDPNNQSIQPILENLYQIVQERLKQNTQLVTKVESMFKIAFDYESDKEKRETAINNLLVLAREKSGAELMFKEGITRKIQSLLKVEKNKEIFIAGVRIVGELCKDNEERTKSIMQDLGIPWLLEIINSHEEQQVNAAQYCLQTILNSLSGMDNKNDTKPKKELIESNKKEIDTFLTCLVYSITNRTISGLARDALIELITRNIHYTLLDWAERLIEIHGLERLLEVASELQEYKYESAMEITNSTSTIVSVCLSRIYENMYYDEAKQRFSDRINEYIKDKLLTPENESKVRVVVIITSLLLGPMDVGNSLLAREGIMEMILVMAGSDDTLQQKVACECIIAASSKKDKIQAIVKQGIDILKKLYQSKNENIKVRALVGLCKLGSSGGTDASIRPFADGSTSKLAEACRRFLINPAKDTDIRRWSVEGLSYLTLDADVKEKLIEDRPAIRAMIELAKTGQQNVVYGVVTTLVNLCNAYEKQEVIPEMIELAKFAKHHIPQEHELDDPDFVAKRIEVLAKEGITSALVTLAKTDSNNCKELIARVFNAICSQNELRGIVVQQGGTKILLTLSLDGTINGKKQAAQALARIGISINPEVAFPGQRCLEVIRPLLSLLHTECSGLENFESLLALCNLAGVNETIRKRILKDGGLQKVEMYMYEEHELLRRAAVQVMTNLIQSPEVIERYEEKNDRAKLLVLLCAEEDEETAKAAAGALAILTSISKKACKKVFEPESWLESFHYLLGNPNQELQYRGVVILLNMMSSYKEVAEKLIDTDIMEILMALSTISQEGKEKIQKYATDALKAAEEWKLIQKPSSKEDKEQDDIE